MNEDDIKTIRQSFTNPFREDLPKPHKNQFGHTVIGEEKVIDTTNIKVKLNDFGEVVAEGEDILSTPSMQNFIENFGRPVSDLEKIEALNPTDPMQNLISNNMSAKNVNILDLISELDQMESGGESSNIHPVSTTKRENNLFVPGPDGMVQVDQNTKVGWHKSCLNKDCLYGLPKDAKFCMKCGTAQMPKFCTECGFNFPGMEKFCPDCGTKR